MVIVSFDFSINKPALSIFDDTKIEIFVFPINIDKITYEKLKFTGVNIFDRGLDNLHRKSYTENELIMEQVSRANNLTNLIISTINTYILENKIDKENVVICNEGLSYGSNGSATLDLSGYKYILINELVKSGYCKFETFSPITIKKSAGCSGRGTTKLNMVDAARNLNLDHQFLKILKNNPEFLKKKVNYIPLVDDIVDSLFCGISYIKKYNQELYEKINSGNDKE